MAKKKPSYYAVARGFNVGIYSTWPECEQQVKGAKGAIYEGFDKHEDAIAYIKQYNWNSGAESAPQKLNSTPSNSAREQIEEAPWFAGEVATEKQQEKCKTDSFEAVTSGSKPGTDLVVTENSKVRTVEVYTDGASSSNGKSNAQAGWGVYWPESENPASDLFGRNESGRLPGAVQTNNRGELMGIIRAIQLCPDPTAQLIIYSDSQYSIKAINEWQRNWRKNKWLTSKKEAVVNKDLIRLLERELRSRFLRPMLVYVKGHSTNIGNQKADKLAVAGAKLPVIPPHLWPDYEPSDSEDDSLQVSHPKAVNFWIKAGFTEDQARARAAPLIN